MDTAVEMAEAVGPAATGVTAAVETAAMVEVETVVAVIDASLL